jgi:hypothetical protein
MRVQPLLGRTCKELADAASFSMRVASKQMYGHTVLEEIAACRGSCPVPRIFGGVEMTKVSKKDTVTFDDIAGIDQVKSEIMELVKFLRNPKRFLDMGVRSPAGVLLVGPPGAGAGRVDTGQGEWAAWREAQRRPCPIAISGMRLHRALQLFHPLRTVAVRRGHNVAHSILTY